MKQIKSRPLSLNRESLRRLTTVDLGMVRGGASGTNPGPESGAPPDKLTMYISEHFTNCTACPRGDLTKSCGCPL
jgi:hypothetical protein